MARTTSSAAIDCSWLCEIAGRSPRYADGVAHVDEALGRQLGPLDAHRRPGAVLGRRHGRLMAFMISATSILMFSVDDYVWSRASHLVGRRNLSLVARPRGFDGRVEDSRCVWLATLVTGR
jgi:hypothetical protein